MKYMLLVYAHEGVWTETEAQQCYEDSAALARELKAEGRYIDASPLHPVATAKSVRVQNNKRLVTDGPFAETHEQLGGYFMIDVKDLEEAIAVAGRIPGVSKGTIEIRPILDIPGLPTD